MKKLVVLSFLAALAYSCSNECDTSTPESAVKCSCEISQKIKEAERVGDNEALLELKKEDDANMESILLRVEHGDYSMMQYAQAVLNNPCQ